MVAKKTEFHLLASDPEQVVIRKSSNTSRQFFVTISLDLLAFSYGASCGWTSGAISVLRSEDTPMSSGLLSASEISWIASGICIGGFIGNLIFGWVSF